MTKLAKHVSFVVALATVGIWSSEPVAQDSSRISIKNHGFLDIGSTNVDAGPSWGDILNNHYFPALECFKVGYLTRAKAELDYVIARPDYMKMNPKQAEFMTNACYLRGLIFFYHASGVGRHLLAKRDFEQSIRWSPKNYQSHLELARVWASVGKKDQAITVLQRLLAMEPDEATVEQAKKELATLNSPQGASK